MTESELAAIEAALPKGAWVHNGAGFLAAGSINVDVHDPYYRPRDDAEADARQAALAASLARYPEVVRHARWLEGVLRDMQADSEAHRRGVVAGRLAGLRLMVQRKRPRHGQIWFRARQDRIEDKEDLPPLLFDRLDGGMQGTGDDGWTRRDYDGSEKAMAALEAAIERLARDGWEDAS